MGSTSRLVTEIHHMEAATIFECESTVTDRYQTTIPAEVRVALKVGRRDKLLYRVSSAGEVMLTKSEPEDPVLEQFLSFVATDIAKHPERVRAIDTGLYDRIRTLVGHIDVDLNEPLSADDE